MGPSVLGMKVPLRRVLLASSLTELSLHCKAQAQVWGDGIYHRRGAARRQTRPREHPRVFARGSEH